MAASLYLEHYLVSLIRIITTDRKMSCKDPSGNFKSALQQEVRQ